MTGHYRAAMESFEDKIAVVTGAGTGMGRELAIALAGEGAHLALCDVNAENLAETATRCRDARGDVTVTVHHCDVSNEADLERFRDEMLEQHDTDHINLLFNNAGIGGRGSFVTDDREGWERTFDVSWRGVYLGCRVFLPLLIAAEEGHIINTSSVNGIWASLGPNRSHTAYSAAKFAVRGFTESLVTDLRLNAPHVAASVVIPGHIGTEIVANSMAIQGDSLDPEVTELSNAFRNMAPTTAEQAAWIILDGVKDGRWRILVGEDAQVVDVLVRDEPEGVYEQPFAERLKNLGVLDLLVQ